MTEPTPNPLASILRALAKADAPIMAEHSPNFIEKTCGCKVFRDFGIEYCPKHGASGKLLESLKRATYFLDQIRLGNAYSEETLWTEIQRYQSAINKAEGRLA